MQTLDEYAAEHAKKTGPRCSVCAAFDARPDLREEIDRARERVHPPSYSTISGYLRTAHQVEVGFQSLMHHYAEGHNVR